MIQFLLGKACIVYDSFLLAFQEGPREIAMREHVLRKDHARMADWVRNLEMLVRRILWILAAGLTREPAPRVHPKRPREKRLHYSWPQAPSTWRAPFRVTEREASGARRWKPRREDDPPPKRFVPTWRLAHRLEAIRRVLERPAAAAWRLARLMARRRSSTRNEPSTLILRAWDFTPERRTLGKHAIAEAMAVADGPSQDAFDDLMRPPEAG